MSECNSDHKICEQLARCLYSDIRGYISEHQSEFEQWVKEEREE
jgi:pyruvoyl-dependent arginine decarboxylase (PvlArgDC)